MHLLEIRDVKNKRWEKVWENPGASMFGFDASDHCTKGTHRVYIEDKNGDLLWHLVVLDEDLDQYWEKAYDFDTGKRIPGDHMIDSSKPEVGSMPFSEYVTAHIEVMLVEDVYQIPFIEETKELSKLVESLDYHWRVSPDIGVLWSEEHGLEWDT